MKFFVLHFYLSYYPRVNVFKYININAAVITKYLQQVQNVSIKVRQWKSFLNAKNQK